MTDTAATSAEAAAPQIGDEASSSFWPDEIVDTIAALVVVSCLTLAVLWFVING